MLFTILFIIITLKFFRDRTIKNISKIAYFSGITLIVVNVFWTHMLTASYFEGSDATAYYLSAKNVKDNFELLNFINIRYIGFNIYQIVAAWPYFNNQQLASILIKLTSWTLFFLSFLHVLKSLHNLFNFNLLKNRFVYYSIIIMGLWLSLYNFRDIIILTCLLFISSIYLGNIKYRALKIIFFLFILFYFRFFYVVLILVSFSIGKIIEYSWRNNIFRVRKINLLFISILIIIFGAFSLSTIDFLNTILSQSETTLNASMQFNIRADNPLISVAKGFFAGNTLDFWLNYFFGNFSRAFTITPISAILMGLIFLFSYVYFLQMFVITVKSKRLMSNLVFVNIYIEFCNSKKLLLLFLTIILFTFLSIITYSINMEVVQERILVPILILISIIISLVYEKGEIRKLLNQIKIFAIISIFMIFVFMLR